MTMPLADFWNSKYPKAEIVYAGRPLPGTSRQYEQDVRRFLSNDDVVLWRLCEKHAYLREASGRSSDAVVFAVHKFVQWYVRYVSDASVTTGWPEYWQYPCETAARREGDCEDGALLIVSLCRVLGVPADRIRVAAGNVEGGGHAWASYRRESDEQWVAADWCYLSDHDKPVAQRPPLKEREFYLRGEGVWFSFNDYFAWSHRAVVEIKGRIQTEGTWQ